MNTAWCIDKPFHFLSITEQIDYYLFVGESYSQLVPYRDTAIHNTEQDSTVQEYTIWDQKTPHKF